MGKSHRREDIQGRGGPLARDSLSRKCQRAPPARERATGAREAGTSPRCPERFVSDTGRWQHHPPPTHGRAGMRTGPGNSKHKAEGTSGQSQSVSTGAGATAVFPGRSTSPATPLGRALGLRPQDCDLPGSEVQSPGSSPGLAGLQHLLRLGHADPSRSPDSAPPAALLHLRRLLQQHRLWAPYPLVRLCGCSHLSVNSSRVLRGWAWPGSGVPCALCPVTADVSSGVLRKPGWPSHLSLCKLETTPSRRTEGFPTGTAARATLNTITPPSLGARTRPPEELAVRGQG